MPTFAPQDKCRLVDKPQHANRGRGLVGSTSGRTTAVCEAHGRGDRLLVPGLHEALRAFAQDDSGTGLRILGKIEGALVETDVQWARCRRSSSFAGTSASATLTGGSRCRIGTRIASNSTG